jgi:hypothetical protein
MIRQSRWDLSQKCDWLGEADFANTDENSLSVWLLDDDKKDLDDVTAALVASREKTDKLDYVLFMAEHLHAVGIEVCEESGTTPDEQVNALHRNLTHLSAAQVLALTTRVWHENLGLNRIDQRTALQLVRASVSCGRIRLEQLRPKLREDVRVSLGQQQGGPPAPK